MAHETKILAGTDSRNYITRCSCGWGYSNTFIACYQRATLHQKVFAKERRRWDDPNRQEVMPIYNLREAA